MLQVEHTTRCLKWEFDVLDEKETAKAFSAEDEIYSKSVSSTWRCRHCPSNGEMTYIALTRHLKLR